LDMSANSLGGTVPALGSLKQLSSVAVLNCVAVVLLCLRRGLPRVPGS
jgi:hypothetical protein